ncbi:MAG: extracellular solute-binding protein [Thermoproteota archaeon]|nr:extracellular solute-binding protein [Thermoproteota archaeon]
MIYIQSRQGTLLTILAIALIVVVSVYPLTVPILFNDATANATSTAPSLSPTTQQEAQQNSMSTAQKRQVTLVAVLDDQGDPPRWMDWLLRPAIEELNERHPDLNITLDYRPIPYQNLHEEFANAMANQTAVDIMTVDYIWLGEYVEKGYLTDLTEDVQKWGRQDEWYSANWAGGIYNNKVYGIWTMADVRGIWYWKDMLAQANVDPNSLRTWDGYISAARKLNSVLQGQGIQGVHLTGAGHSPDLWYPYLWMQGGEIIKQKEGHPTKGLYWFPAFNGTEGVKALSFIKQQIDAGVEPQKQHFWGKEFLDRKFAVMLEALQHHVNSIGLNTTEQKQAFEEKVGFFPTFPVPSLNNSGSTLLGGWLLSVPQTSTNKALAWELITIIVEPEIMAPFHAKYGWLPTQIPIGNGPYAQDLDETIPYFEELISTLSIARARPNIPEYPQIEVDILEAINQVYNGTKQPEEALDEAAAKSAGALGW